MFDPLSLLDSLPESEPRPLTYADVTHLPTLLGILAESCLNRTFLVSALFVLGSPLGWNVLGRVEHYTRAFTRLFRSKFVGCYVTSAYIFTFSIFRNAFYEHYLSQAPSLGTSSAPFDPASLGGSSSSSSSSYEILGMPFDAAGADWVRAAAGYLLMFLGALFVVTSSWALGIIGTYNGDYFGILMEERITHFPFSVLDNPMYVGSTLLFLSRAVQTGSPGGLVLTAWVWIVYKVGCFFEEPFTTMIYSEAEVARNEVALKAAGSHPEQFNVEHGDVLDWGAKEVSFWLKEEIGASSQVIKAFRDNDVDGTVLCRLTVDMCRDDLGVSSLGLRFRIVDAVREARDSYLRRLERKKGNKWISERKGIEARIRGAIDARIGEIRLVNVIQERVRRMAKRVTSRSPEHDTVNSSFEDAGASFEERKTKTPTPKKRASTRKSTRAATKTE